MSVYKIFFAIPLLSWHASQIIPAPLWNENKGFCFLQILHARISPQIGREMLRGIPHWVQTAESMFQSRISFPFALGTAYVSAQYEQMSVMRFFIA